MHEKVLNVLKRINFQLCASPSLHEEKGNEGMSQECHGVDHDTFKESLFEFPLGISYIAYNYYYKKLCRSLFRITRLHSCLKNR